MNLPIANIARFATTTATSIAVNKVVTEVVKNNIPAAASKLDLYQIKAGAAVLSFVTGSMAVKIIEENWDAVAKKVTERKAQVDTVTD